MARTIEVTKVGVTSSREGLNHITFKLKYLEDAAELINKDYTEDHKAGQAPSVVTAKFQSRMQNEIDLYKQAEAVSNHALMGTAISNLQSSLEV